VLPFKAKSKAYLSEELQRKPSLEESLRLSQNILKSLYGIGDHGSDLILIWMFVYPSE